MNDSKIHRYVVFDGPGLFSNTIQKTKKYITTSTFQCLILFLKPNKSEGLFTFASEKTPVDSHINIIQTNKSIFHYPNEKCKQSYCILSFHADRGYQINITTISIKSKMSTYNFNCLYAGLYAGEGLESGMIETQKLTGNNDGQAISFYSHNSSMILFMYRYKGISEINASLMISQIKCKPVLINPCILFHCGTQSEYIKCPGNQIEFQHVQHSANIPYIHNLLNFSGIDIVLIDFFKIRSMHEFEYALQRINCIIILISNVQPLHIPIKSCMVMLSPRHAVDIQLRFTRYNLDFTIKEKKLEVSKKNLTFFRKFSEPKIPRLMFKNKIFRSDIPASLENLTGQKVPLIPRNKTLISGIHLSQDASFIFDIHTFLSKSRIELLIQTSALKTTSYLHFRKFAMDFLCCNIHRGSLYDYHNFHTTSILPSAKPTILLKSKSKVSDPNILLCIEFVICVKWSWSFAYKYQVYWRFTFPFYHLKYGKYISIIGDKTKDALFRSISLIDIPRTEPLTVVWMKDNYIRHKTFLELNSEKCFIKDKTWLCKKIKVNESAHYREYYVITQRIKFNYKLKSWEQAANICQLVGGHLPWFESRDSLDELMALFKLSRHFPTIEAIYIGLKHNTTEVSKIVLSFVFCTSKSLIF